ncbi:urease subunit beta [Sporolactobacillus terrae]|uniref:urease subunit beta n=1 Tax=Sporolactobacillus terrae TaxID=269673 RepID=UPI00111A234C|nr:urease subunit beta [Sporolactobacillus terrae]
MIPGETKCYGDPIQCNVSKETRELEVINTGDRPIQVGSHFHFYEVNSALKFDRSKALGFRLNIPAGTAVRFEPSDAKIVPLVALSGTREVYGLNNLTNGKIDKK